MHGLSRRIKSLEGRYQNQTPACQRTIYQWSMAQGIEMPEPTSNQTAPQWLALLPTETLSAILRRYQNASA